MGGNRIQRPQCKAAIPKGFCSKFDAVFKFVIPLETPLKSSIRDAAFVLSFSRFSELKKERGVRIAAQRREV
ncbi:hypothetical protein AAHA92_20160 [Salvia divinorum]|uniref:Uncharacterized protein n=1 Tax=Salvia divinorum TaxID=28513 RepID=A0ABD1GGA1_SALDI